MTDLQSKIKTYLEKTEPLNQIKDLEKFTRRMTAAYDPEWVSNELFKIVAWLGTKPLRETQIKSWERFVGNWLRRGKGDAYNLKQLGKVFSKIGKPMPGKGE